MDKRTCLNCGKKFQVPYPSSKRQNCSEECRIARLRKPDRKTRADKGTRKSKWVTRDCPTCAKSFDLPPAEAKDRRYCSRECRPRQGDLCTREGCDQETFSKNLCTRHYMHQYRSQPEVREREAEYHRRYHLKKYGLTDEQWNELAAQHKVCAICGEEPGSGRLFVDHCHESEAVRALLCRSCNAGLGHFKDDPARLRAAANYIERHR